MRDDEYSAIKDRAVRTLLDIPGVNAVGIGGREVAGQATGERAIKVFVTRKMPADQVAPGELIPSSFEGVPVDVVEGGPFRRAAGPTQDIPTGAFADTSPYDPLCGGISLATEGTPGLGTLGCFLVDKNDATAVYALTNHHVVAKAGKLSRSRRVLHPSTIHWASPPTQEDIDQNAIGIVAAGGQEAIRDAALVRLSAGMKWLPAIKDVGFLAGTYPLVHDDAVGLNYRVWKRGVVTGLISGIVQGVDCTVKDILDEGTQTKSITKGNIIIKERTDGSPFAQPGDSGSAVVNDDSKVVGLLYGNDGKGGGYATPIATVLRRFNEVDQLDLAIAQPKTDAPTEATETQVVPPPGGKPAIPAAQQADHGDRQYCRPLTGGAPILVAPMVGAAQAATMGCVLAAGDGDGPAYLVTAYSALTAGDTLPPTADTSIGQPDNAGHCCRCTSNTVGHFFAGPDSQKRIGFVALSSAQKWLPEIMQVGLLNGVRDLTADPLPDELPVLKQGGGSGLTGGVITKIDSTIAPFAGQPTIVIRPNPNAAAPLQPLYFSQFNDRGAAVVDQNNKVVGVLYGELQVTDSAGTHFHGLAAPIKEVLSALAAQTSSAVSVPEASAIDDVRTAVAHVADRAEGLLRAPAAGALPAIPAPWGDHQSEIQDLIAHNRKVAAMWRRHGGPALTQALFRAFHAQAEAIPLFVGGVPLTVCLERLSGVFCKYGSVELRASLARLRTILPAVGGGRLSEVLSAAREALAIPGATP